MVSTLLHSELGTTRPVRMFPPSLAGRQRPTDRPTQEQKQILLPFRPLLCACVRAKKKQNAAPNRSLIIAIAQTPPSASPCKVSEVTWLPYRLTIISDTFSYRLATPHPRQPDPHVLIHQKGDARARHDAYQVWSEPLVERHQPFLPPDVAHCGNHP